MHDYLIGTGDLPLKVLQHTKQGIQVEKSFLQNEGDIGKGWSSKKERNKE